MPLNPGYTADPTNVAQPLDTVSGGYAAREIRALKTYIRDVVLPEIAVVMGGSANEYTMPTWPAALVNGQVYSAVVPVANTGASTLQPGGGAALPIKNYDGSDMVPGQLPENAYVQFYKTAAALYLVNPRPLLATAAVPGIVKITADRDEVGADTTLNMDELSAMNDELQAVITSNASKITRTNYATNSQGGTVKMRRNGSTLYIRNDGTNA